MPIGIGTRLAEAGVWMMNVRTVEGEDPGIMLTNAQYISEDPGMLVHTYA